MNELLVKPLVLPLPPELTSEVTGIHQSDVIIRSALIAAIADMRANPWLLDYAFASLAKDALTMKEYGEKEILQAKKWFLNTEIPIFMSANPVEPKFPCLSISLSDSNEAETTLADTHYKPDEDNATQWLPLSEPFAPVTYNASTGTMMVPESVTEDLVLRPGMFVVDATGRPHLIEDVGGRVVKLAPGTVADFAGSVIKGDGASFKVALESQTMRESYLIGCHVQNEPVHLTYLHSITVFILLRYKQALLEARGYERSQINSSDFRRNDAFDPEFVYSRHIQISGFVRQVWPKVIAPKVTGVAVSPLIVANTPTSRPPLAPTLDNDESWLDQDSLNTRFR